VRAVCGSAAGVSERDLMTRVVVLDAIRAG
jgi:hypothetical protein